MLVKSLAETSSDGHLYRVDLRLRPEGRTGPSPPPCAPARCTTSRGTDVGAAGAHQGSSRGGDLWLGESFLRMVSPFVYRQSAGLFGAGRDPRHEEPDQRLPGQARGERRNVKLGYAGSGDRVPDAGPAARLRWAERLVREPNTLRALHRLSGQGLIADADYAVLARPTRSFASWSTACRSCTIARPTACPTPPKS